MPQKNLTMKILNVHLATVLMLVFAVSAQAETYRWTDDAGVVHFSDNHAKIPSRYRKKATVEKDMSSVNIMPANNEPERGASGEGTAVRPGQETDPKKITSSKHKTSTKHAKKGHRKPSQVVKTPPAVTTPARQEQNETEERVRKDRQAIDDAQAPARRAQDQAEEKMKKGRDGVTGH